MISPITENKVVSPDTKGVEAPRRSLGFEYFKPEIVGNKTRAKKLQIIETTTEIILQILDNKSDREIVVFSKNDKNQQIVTRIKKAWEWEAEEELIATAQTREDLLIVMGCNLKLWQIDMKSIPCLKEITPPLRANFEIDEDGSYLNWEAGDIHLDLEAIRAEAEPELRQQLLLEKLQYNREMGKAISTLRKEYRINQSEIEGLSDRHLRRIENEGYQVTLETLKKLAAAHQLDLSDYLRKINQKIENIGT